MNATLYVVLWGCILGPNILWVVPFREAEARELPSVRPSWAAQGDLCPNQKMKHKTKTLTNTNFKALLLGLKG